MIGPLSTRQRCTTGIPCPRSVRLPRPARFRPTNEPTSLILSSRLLHSVAREYSTRRVAPPRHSIHPDNYTIHRKGKLFSSILSREYSLGRLTFVNALPRYSVRCLLARMPLARPSRSERETAKRRSYGGRIATKRAASDQLEKTRRRGGKGEEVKRAEETSRAEPRNISAALVIFIVWRTGCRELLACEVIVFDAVILQCRACTHAFPPRATDTSRRSVVITAVLFLLLGDWRQSVVGSFFDVTQRSATAIRCSETICQVARESLPSRRPGTPRAVSTSRLTFPRKSLAPSARYPPPCSPPLAHDARAVTRTSFRLSVLSVLCSLFYPDALPRHDARSFETLRFNPRRSDNYERVASWQESMDRSSDGKVDEGLVEPRRARRGRDGDGTRRIEARGENGRGLETTKRDAKKRSGGRGREERSAVVPVAGEAAPPEGRKAVRVALVSLDRTFGSLPFVPVVHTRSRIRALTHTRAWPSSSRSGRLAWNVGNEAGQLASRVLGGVCERTEVAASYHHRTPLQPSLSLSLSLSLFVEIPNAWNLGRRLCPFPFDDGSFDRWLDRWHPITSQTAPRPPVGAPLLYSSFWILRLSRDPGHERGLSGLAARVPLPSFPVFQSGVSRVQHRDCWYSGVCVEIHRPK